MIKTKTMASNSYSRSQFETRPFVEHCNRDGPSPHRGDPRTMGSSRERSSPRSWSRDRTSGSKEYSRSRDRNSRVSPSYSPPRRGGSRADSPPRHQQRHTNSGTKRSLSPPPDYKQDIKRFPSGPSKRYTMEDVKALQTLNCEICDVKLFDEDTMRSHLDGARHLQTKQKIIDDTLRKQCGRGIAETMKVDKSNQRWNYDDSFWTSADNVIKREKYKDPNLAKVYDTERFDRLPAKFNRKNYDHGQFKDNKRDLHCEVCNVDVATRDVMESHKAGKEHQRRAADVKRFTCDICLINVPCQNTLDNHMMGKDHIKRVKQLEEKQKKEGILPNTREYGYKTGPKEMAKLTPGDMQRMQDLERDNANLRRIIVDLNEAVKQCKNQHGPVQKVKEELDRANQRNAQLEKVNAELRRHNNKLQNSAAKLNKKTEKFEFKEYTEDAEDHDVINLE